MNVTTIRLSANYVYFVYYYIDVCDSTLIGIFFSKTKKHVSFFHTIETKWKSIDNYAIDHNQ